MGWLPPADWIGPWTLGVLGLLVGSFLNVVIHRWPLMMERQWWRDVAGQLQDAESFQRITRSEAPAHFTIAAQDIDQRMDKTPALTLSTPRSRCPHCSSSIHWFDNVPVVSWIALGGRCRACQAPISLRYPAIELLTASLFALAGARHPGHWVGLAWCAWLAGLLALSAIDWDTTLLPDDMTLPLLWAGLMLSMTGWTLDPSSSLLGAALGWGSLWLIHSAFLKITGRQGMGAGDFKLLGAMGAWLGPWAILPTVLVASIAGSVVGLTMKARGALREGRYVPFGPFLAAGGFVVWALGTDRLLRWLGW